MMRADWLWDRKISMKEVKAILTDEHHERFVETAALLLSRKNTPHEVFDQYVDQKVFVQQWAKIKRSMRKNDWNDPRIIFWQAVYEKLRDDLKEKGISIRKLKENSHVDNLCREVGEQIRQEREVFGYTQKVLAHKIGVSQQVISRIESGRANVSILTLIKVSKFLGKVVTIKLEATWYAGRLATIEQGKGE